MFHSEKKFISNTYYYPSGLVKPKTPEIINQFFYHQNININEKCEAIF